MKQNLLLLFSILFCTQISAQVLYSEDFESLSLGTGIMGQDLLFLPIGGYPAGVPFTIDGSDVDFSSSSSDYIRIDVSASELQFQDLEGEGIVTFDAIDISSQTGDITIQIGKVDFNIDSEGEWPIDASDYIDILYSLDEGATFTRIPNHMGNGNMDHTFITPPIPADATRIGLDFDFELSETIDPGTATTLILRLSGFNDSGDEEFEFDDIDIIRGGISLFSEDFSGYDGINGDEYLGDDIGINGSGIFAAIDAGDYPAVPWTLTLSDDEQLENAEDFILVNEQSGTNVLEYNDLGDNQPVFFDTDLIDITGHDEIHIGFDMNFRETTYEAEDFVDVFYSLDNGATFTLAKDDGNGHTYSGTTIAGFGINEDQAFADTLMGLTSNDFILRIVTSNDSGNEDYQLDNIIVQVEEESSSSPIVITEIQYNHPSWDDDEFIELYNNSGADIQMEGYYIGDGFDYVFPNYNFEAGTYLVLALESDLIMTNYGVSSLEWEDGTLSNNGEDVSLYTPDDVLVDYVDYEDNSDGWSLIADGSGHSLSLCDINADNENPENWEITVLDNPIVQGRRMSHASPGSASSCFSGPIVTSRVINDLIEGTVKDTASFTFYMTNGNGMPSSLTISVDPSSTASPDDYEILNSVIEFDGTVTDTFRTFRVITGEDDNVGESKETLVLNISIDNNIEKLAHERLEINIYDDDNTLNESLLIVGVFEAEIVDEFGLNIGSGDEFGVELYALNDIPDLSIYGLGTANNGGGTDGIEIPFPSVSLSKGDSYFISDNEIRFTNFFGFAPDLTHPSIWITGNDAIELFEHGLVIDTYATINSDPEGTPWEYDKGWATRVPNTGPNGDTPVMDEWNLNFTGVLIGETNDTSIIPYPLNSYSNNIDAIENLAHNLSLQISPNPVEETLNLSFDEIELENVSILDYLGSMVLQKNYTNSLSQDFIDVSSLAPGIYFVSLKTSKGTATEKFIKR